MTQQKPDSKTVFSRRALVAGAVGTAIAATPIQGKQQSAETPILKLFHEYQAIIKAAEAHVSLAAGKDEDEELERLFYRNSDKIKAEMMAMPCTCAADFAAKIIVDTSRGFLFSDWETGKIWAEARELTGCQL